MIRFPNAKINLGLHVTAKRPDGFHELETVFYPVQWCDALEVISGGNQPFSMSMSGLAVDAPLEKNLCYKAWQLLSERYTLPPIQAHLHKVLPMGAGLGGGSSDAASMLRLISEVAQLNCPDAELQQLAAKLGSDCAFFVRNKPCIATGRGELLREIPVDLSGRHIVIVMPPTTVGTAEAYSWITPKAPAQSLEKVIGMPVKDWKDHLVNDFEAAVFPKKPMIAEVKSSLYKQGALYAAMSGSGAAVFGIFNTAPNLSFGPEMTVYNGQL